jgi:hypothetical protein
VEIKFGKHDKKVVGIAGIEFKRRETRFILLDHKRNE